MTDVDALTLLVGISVVMHILSRLGVNGVKGREVLRSRLPPLVDCAFIEPSVVPLICMRRSSLISSLKATRVGISLRRFSFIQSGCIRLVILLVVVVTLLPSSSHFSPMFGDRGQVNLWNDHISLNLPKISWYPARGGPITLVVFACCIERTRLRVSIQVPW